MNILDFEDFLTVAEKQFLLDGATQFSFPIRKRGAWPDFYSRLEQELQTHGDLRVLSFRQVREGFARLSRPSVLGFDLGTLLRHRPHLSLLRAEFQRLETDFTFIAVFSFLRHHLGEASQNVIETRACFEVLQYLIDHSDQVAGLLPRQIPHGQSTKLIGKAPLLLSLFAFWRESTATWADFFAHFKILDKPLEFRFYAPICRYDNQLLPCLHSVLATEWQDRYSFAELQATLIVENLETFFSLETKVKNTLLVWGAGWRATQIRSLLNRLPKPIFYWGDIDKEGYEIFGWLRNLVPDLVPLLMSEDIFDKWKHLCQKREVYLGPYRSLGELQDVYEKVCQSGLQIEQEQIHESWPFDPRLA